MPILKIKARQIFDSRGDPTLEVDMITDIGLLRSSVPCTLAPNPNEAVDLRDGIETSYNGRSVFKAVDNINNILAPAILKSKLDVCQQGQIDALMIKLDGTENKSKLGANAILGISIACCKAGAAKKGLPLYKYIAQLAENGRLYIPVPVFTVISGGKAANNGLPFEAYMIMPIGAVSFADAMKMGSEIYREIERKISEKQEKKLPLLSNGEGAFAPAMENEEVLTLMDEAIKTIGYDGKVKLALDIGASAFNKDGMYDLALKSDDTEPEDYLETEALKERHLELLTVFPNIVSIEDPFDQEDWDGWPLLADQPIQIVADELTAMNVERIEEAVEKQAANCLLIRLIQIGTITEAINCCKMARLNGWGTMVSAGFGETEDAFIADFSVGVSCGQIKVGGPCRSERTAKYNQILRIEEELGKYAKYAGNNFRNPFSN
ncbi:enolase-like isoform X1 [Belonocnema kinseyi]|uniref:enolase-like isoform X1 n=1 Tax=Belonocnema kinseyi TaxID=2817044 RepID=UPI00143D72EB|nr:enolase-like isoform X1 [Belonocnema kinseyi]XP_033221759.1 enolase-like isoform X1 [Belonocnema kinseyi]